MEFIGETVLRFFLYLIGFIIIIIIAYFIRKVASKRNIKNYPASEELGQLKQKIRLLKNNGKDYNSIISTLKSQFAYSKGIIQGVIIDIENEATAIIDNPKSIIKSGYLFKYPANWKITPIDDSLDDDKFFSIEGSHSGAIMFSIFDGNKHDFPSLSEINENLGNEYRNFETKNKIYSWGQLKGEGNNFHAIAINNPCLGSIFRFENEKHAFYVVKLAMEDDYQNVHEGFQLIETTFKIESNL